MPYFKLETNVSNDKITLEILKEISKAVASTLGKPESYVTVNILGDQKMIWAGTTDPCGFVTLLSVGQLGIQQNKKHSKVLTEIITQRLGIPKDRFYISFVDSPPSTVGYNGSTFHGILGDS